jgi:hypothetical protein
MNFGAGNWRIIDYEPQRARAQEEGTAVTKTLKKRIERLERTSVGDLDARLRAFS